MGKRNCLFRYTILFCIVFAGAFFAFFMNGKSLIWKSDGYRQYVPALTYIGRYYREILSNVFHGNFSLPMMDYSIGQGEDIITTFANYGLGDPLTLLSVVVPARYTEYLYDCLVILRMFLSGLTFLVYCMGMKLSKKNSLVGALIYVFCGFAIWSVKDPFFLNAMIYLPLVLLGVEWTMRKKNPLLLAISVLLSIVSGYYFFYMTVLCAICYFGIRSTMINGRNIRRTMMDALRCILVSSAGVLMSCVIFIPSAYGFLSSTRTENHTPFTSFLVYPLSYYKTMFSRLFAVAENDDASAVGFLTMSVIVLLALFVLVKKRGGRYHALKLCVILSFVAVASPFIGFVFNGFGYITNRFMFIPSFLLSVVVVLIWPDILNLERRDKIRFSCVCVIYAILCFLLSSKEGVIQYAAMILMLLAVIVCLFLIKSREKLHIALLIVVCVNLIINGNLLYQKFGVGMIDAYEEAGSGYDAYMSDSAVNSAKKRMKGDMDRIDVMLHEGQNPNQSVVAGYKGISVYYSVINSGYCNYMMSMENAQGLMYSHRMLGNDGRFILENLANVKYVAAKNASEVPYGFEPVANSKNLYQNTLKTSIGYTYDAYMSETDFDQSTVYERQDSLLDGAVISNHSKLMEQIKKTNFKRVYPSSQNNSLQFEMTNLKHLKWDKGTLKVNRTNGSFKIQCEMEPGKEYYIRFAGLELGEADTNNLWANVSMDGLNKSFIISDPTYDFYFGRSNYLVNLGVLDSSEKTSQMKTITVRLNGPAKYQLENIELVSKPVDQIVNKVVARNSESLQNVKLSGNQLSGKIETLSDRILCIAVPYKMGYTLYVDGQQVNIDQINKMYIGTLIGAGKHDILLKYCTPGIKIGFILTMIGVIYTIFLWVLYKRRCA